MKNAKIKLFTLGLMMSTASHAVDVELERAIALSEQEAQAADAARAQDDAELAAAIAASLQIQQAPVAAAVALPAPVAMPAPVVALQPAGSASSAVVDPRLIPQALQLPDVWDPSSSTGGMLWGLVSTLNTAYSSIISNIPESFWPNIIKGESLHKLPRLARIEETINMAEKDITAMRTLPFFTFYNKTIVRYVGGGTGIQYQPEKTSDFESFMSTQVEPMYFSPGSKGCGLLQEARASAMMVLNLSLVTSKTVLESLRTDLENLHTIPSAATESTAELTATTARLEATIANLSALIEQNESRLTRLETSK